MWNIFGIIHKPLWSLWYYSCQCICIWNLSNEPETKVSPSGLKLINLRPVDLHISCICWAWKAGLLRRLLCRVGLSGDIWCKGMCILMQRPDSHRKTTRKDNVLGLILLLFGNGSSLWAEWIKANRKKEQLLELWIGYSMVLDLEISPSSSSFSFTFSYLLELVMVKGLASGVIYTDSLGSSFWAFWSWWSKVSPHPCICFRNVQLFRLDLSPARSHTAVELYTFSYNNSITMASTCHGQLLLVC